MENILNPDLFDSVSGASDRATSNFTRSENDTTSRSYHHNTGGRFVKFKKGECPICRGVHDRCKRQDYKVFCGADVDAPGYKNHGITSNGAFYYYTEIDENYTAEKREAYRKEWERQEKERLEGYKASLSESDRDIEHKKLVNQLTLSPEHRELLRNRGFNDADIDRLGYRSVEKFQSLSEPINPNLAGINSIGKGLTYFGTEGILCPIPNALGELAGFKIHNPNWKQENSGKYIWAVSKANKNRKKTASSHLQNGELPMAYHDGGNLSIGFSEGPEFKSALISINRGGVCIGASGGQVQPEQFRRYLKGATQHKDFIIWADSGSCQNRQVISNYQKIADLATEEGFKVKVAWWGQSEKAKGMDPDEYFGKFSLIHWEDWLREYCGIKPKLRITHFDQAKKVATNAVNSFAQRLKDALTPKVKPASECCVSYEPGKLREVVKQQKKIEYKSSDRLNIWAEAARGGVKNIIDSSGVGSGKSHAAGNIKPSNFGAERAIYLHSRHANPATLTLGSWDDLPPRHNGLVANPNRKNPDASPHISWPRDGQVPNVPGNCKYAAKFNEAIAANVDYEELKGICSACEFGKKLDDSGKVESNLCQDGEGEGYGYKFQRAIALNSPKLRAHPNSLPPFDAENPEFYDEALIFVDEAEAEMMASIIKEVRVTQAIVKTTFGNLEPKNPELFDLLTPVRRALYAAVENLGKYGKSDRELRDELAHHITANSANPSIFLEMSEEAIAIEQSIAKALTNDVESQIKKHGIEGLQFATNWLPDFIKILKDEAAGSFSINQSGLITLRVKNQKINEILANTKVNILSDATAKAETLIEMVGLDKPQTIEIAESTLRHDNLTITQVNFARHIEKGERSKELQNRINAAHNELTKKYGDDLINFNYKANAKEGDLTTFADNRGVNHAERKLALATIGDPYLHLGAIAADYQAIYGISPKMDEDKAFEAYYLQRCQGEIIQMVGRLRSGRRSEALNYYHFGNLSLDFLTEALPGATVAVVQAGELSPDAAPKDARHISALVAQAIDLVQRGHKLTQAKLAQSLETCQSQISRWLNAIPGGWNFLKSMVLKICKSLYRDSYRELHNFDNDPKALTEEELGFLRDFAEPSLLAAFADDGHSAPDDEMMATTIQVSFEQFGDRAADILAHLSVESGTKLLVWILQKAGLVENSIFQHLRDLAFS